MIATVADAHGLDHGTRDDFNYCVAPSGLSHWTWIETRPALMFSTEDENRQYFGFDAQGCSVPWTYSATC